MELPKISIVTPSYNQGQFLEETIQSVFNQDYPNIEYIIMDGGSTDNSVDIIKKYEDRITCWVSESDKGQSHAINKGFRKCTGNIITWINSDDVYMPKAFNIVGKYFKDNPEVDIVYGDQTDIDEKGATFRALRSMSFNRLALLSRGATISQPNAFFRRKILEEIGYIDESLQWTMDYEFFLRVAFAGYHIRHIPATLAKFRYHRNSKTVSGKMEASKYEERMRMVQRKYLKKIGRHLNMPILNILRACFKIKIKIINLDRYFLYRHYYFQRMKSVLTGGDMHKY